MVHSRKFTSHAVSAQLVRPFASRGRSPTLSKRSLAGATLRPDAPPTRSSLRCPESPRWSATTLPAAASSSLATCRSRKAASRTSSRVFLGGEGHEEDVEVRCVVLSECTDCAQYGSDEEHTEAPLLQPARVCALSGVQG